MFFRSRTLFFLCLSDTRIVSVSGFKEWGWIETQAEFEKKKNSLSKKTSETLSFKILCPITRNEWDISC